MHINLIGTYTKFIRQQNPGGAIIQKDVSLTYMTIIDTTTGWFEIFKVPLFDLKEVSKGNT